MPLSYEFTRSDLVKDVYEIPDKIVALAYAFASRTKEDSVELILAQFALETDWGSSHQFLKNKNCFGIHRAKLIDNQIFQSGADGKFAVFDTWEHCFLNRRQIIQRLQDSYPEADILSLLDTYWAPDNGSEGNDYYDLHLTKLMKDQRILKYLREPNNDNLYEYKEPVMPTEIKPTFEHTWLENLYLMGRRILKGAGDTWNELWAKLWQTINEIEAELIGKDGKFKKEAAYDRIKVWLVPKLNDLGVNWILRKIILTSVWYLIDVAVAALNEWLGQDWGKEKTPSK